MPGTKICQKKFKVTSMVKKYQSQKKPIWKILVERFNNWEMVFSFLKDPESIRNKITSYSHQEYNTEEFTNTDFIKEKIFRPRFI